MIRTLEQDGFAVVPSIIPAETISSVADALEQSRPSRKGAGIRNVLRIPALRALAESAAIFALAKTVLGENAVPIRATLFDKSADSNWLVLWHQDTALPLREKRNVAGWGPWSVKEGVICAHAPAKALQQVLAVRVHLDDSNEANGPLRVLPSTHKLGVLSDDQIEDLVKTTVAIECHVEIGGILLMRPLLVHASSKARSDAPRRVVHIEYAASLSCGEGLDLAVD